MLRLASQALTGFLPAVQSVCSAMASNRKRWENALRRTNNNSNDTNNKLETGVTNIRVELEEQSPERPSVNKAGAPVVSK
jgi:hypothetical protein